LLSALERVDLQAIFDRDAYELRRSALPGTRLVKVLVIYQVIGTEELRGLVRTIIEHTGLQAALGGRSPSIPCPMAWRSGTSPR
jgi:hypothetical protein